MHTARLKVTTESGRVYYITHHHTVQVCDKGTETPREAFKDWSLVDRSLLTISNLLPGESVFEMAMRFKQESPVPVAGMSLFCYSFGSWRISTPIKYIEELGEA